MILDRQHKKQLKQELAACLSVDQEVQRIVVFGSFNDSPNPADMDVAVFQTSNQSYLPLALKYRRQARSVSHVIPLDILPLRTNAEISPFLSEILKGETIYER
jgi:uncharacterized protein